LTWGATTARPYALVERRSNEPTNTEIGCHNAVFIGDMNWDEATDGAVPLPPGWADAWLTHCKPRNAPVRPGRCCPPSPRALPFDSRSEGPNALDDAAGNA